MHTHTHVVPRCDTPWQRVFIRSFAHSPVRLGEQAHFVTASCLQLLAPNHFFHLLTDTFYPQYRRSKLLLLPRHVHFWIDVVQLHTETLAAKSLGSHLPTMCWRRHLVLPSIIVCIRGVLPHQRSTATAVTEFLRLVTTRGGLLVSRPSRNHPVNGVYVIFSRSTRYIYFGETSTSQREFQHWHSALCAPTQRVHWKMQQIGPSRFCMLLMDLPQHVSRHSVEATLIRKFDAMGKYLLNDKGRTKCNSDSRMHFLATPVSLHSNPGTIAPRSRNFFRPYKRIGYTPRTAIAPCRIPAVVFYPSGFGGALVGLISTGCYDIKGVVVLDEPTASAIRRRFRYRTFVMDITDTPVHVFSNRLASFVPRDRWVDLMLLFSTRPTTQTHTDRLRSVCLTRASLRVCKLLNARYWWISTSAPVARSFRSDDPAFFMSVHHMEFYVPSHSTVVVLANIDLGDAVRLTSQTALPALDVLPHLHDGACLLLNGTSTPISEPAPDFTYLPLHVSDPVVRAATVDEVKVLRGFAYGSDLSLTDVQVAISWLSLDIPPLFARVVGNAFSDAHLQLSGPTDQVTTTPREHLPTAPTTYMAYPPGLSFDDLYDALISAVGRPFATITYTPGVYDATDFGDLRRFQGTCAVVFPRSLRPIPLHHGLAALRQRHVNAIVVSSLRVVDPFCEHTLELLRCIFKAKLPARRVPRQLRQLKFWDLHKLYLVLDELPDSPVNKPLPVFVAGVRRKLTRICNIVYNTHPTPRIRLSMVGSFGLSRRAVQRLCFSFVKFLRIPDAARQFIMNSMTVSFTRTESVGDKICNFRKFCDQWRPDNRWSCHCHTIRSIFGIIPGTDTHVPDDSGCGHVHVRFNQCYGTHQRVLHSNLRDVYTPDDPDVHDNIRNALYKFLKETKAFACNIRRTTDFESLFEVPDDSLLMDPETHKTASMASSLGFPFRPETMRLYHKAISPSGEPRHIEVTQDNLDAFKSDTDGPDCLAVVSHLDKNPGLGNIVCPALYWVTLRDALWSNADYERSSHTEASLLALHLQAYTANGWDLIAPFQQNAPPAHIPFIFGKFKSNLKNRIVLSAFKHCLRSVYARVSKALRVCVLAISRDEEDPWNANLNSTFQAPRVIARCSEKAVDHLLPGIPQGGRTGPYNAMTCPNDFHDPDPTPFFGVDAYAGDISKMFDKLPCDIVIRAVEWALATAIATSTRYNLRSECRQAVTINLRDSDGCYIGSSYDGEAVITISFRMILTVCNHYCFQTFFLFATVFFLLQLGVPQGGSMSDPLSKIFCMYCEHNWLSSIFDFSKVSNRGLIRACDMTPHGLRSFSDLLGFQLDPTDDTVLASSIIKRYADDSRSMVFFRRDQPLGPRVANAFITLYKSFCYEKPCTLDDEERGTAYDFMQGYYDFLHGCRTTYTVKNALPLLRDRKRKIRSLQHFDSYSRDPDTLRYACVMGKLAEVDAISSDYPALCSALTLVALEWHSLGYPTKLIRNALYTKFTKTKERKWLSVAHLLVTAMLFYKQVYPNPVTYSRTSRTA